MIKDNFLLKCYEQELNYVRNLYQRYAIDHPQMAKCLNISSHNAPHPHLEQIMQYHALGNAILRDQLEDDYSKIAEAILTTVHPHMLSPIPALSIVQFQVDPKKITNKKNIPAETLLQTINPHFQPCFFTTRYETQLLPLSVTDANLSLLPAHAPIINNEIHSVAVLKLTVVSTDPNQKIGAYGFDYLRFFIHANRKTALTLYEYLFTQAVAIVLANPSSHVKPVQLHRDCLKAVGFQPHENLLPYQGGTLLPYRLMTEYFALPEKFLFFDLANLTQSLNQTDMGNTDKLEIYFYLTSLNHELEKQIRPNIFALGCTPVVNLFETTSQSITLHAQTIEHHLIPQDRIQPEAMEVYNVKSVQVFSDQSREGKKISSANDPIFWSSAYYQLQRKPCWYAGYYPLVGTEVFLSIRNSINHQPISHPWAIRVEMQCTNRNLPAEWQAQPGKSDLKFFFTTPDFLEKISFLKSIENTKYPLSGKNDKWDYIKQLSTQLFSMESDELVLKIFLKFISIYNFSDNKDNFNSAFIQIKRRKKYIRVQRRINGNFLWHGLEITLIVDINYFPEGSIYLFSMLLDHFFSLYMTENYFTELIVRDSKKILYQFKPRPGLRFAI